MFDFLPLNCVKKPDKKGERIMKVLTVVGARPQFIKAAAVSRKLRKEHTELLVHTGQHYDRNMSDIFFTELDIPRPDYNLGVGSGSHAHQTAEMLIGIEDLLLKEKPDAVLVYGDTNSTLAGALAASKIHIPVVHVEAGLRSYNMRMPEEQNRVLTDHISHVLYAPTEAAVENLEKEGIRKHVYNIGDVMCDAVLHYSAEIDKHDPAYFFERSRRLWGEGKMPETWYLATIHRAENTDTPEKVFEVLSAFEGLPCQVIFPVHPRTMPLVRRACEQHCFQNTVAIEPVGYIDMLFYTKNAVKVITDSGGLQKESYILHTPCVTVRDQTEWIETLAGNHNTLCKPERESILAAVLNTEIDEAAYSAPYGNGDAAIKILQSLPEALEI